VLLPLQVEVIALAPAITGDEAFATAFRRSVNARIPRFVGDGFRERDGRRVFEMGDVIPQVCIPDHLVLHTQTDQP
jgi:hypothetical protein